MNLSEFKAWFEGFSENLDGPPDKKQWRRIRETIEKITKDPTPWPIFIERYRRYDWSREIYGPYYSTSGGTIRQGVGVAYNNLAQTNVIDSAPEESLVSNVAWQEAGRLEAMEVAA